MALRRHTGHLGNFSLYIQEPCKEAEFYRRLQSEAVLDLVKLQLLFRSVWGGAWDSELQTGSQVEPMGWSRSHTLSSELLKNITLLKRNS